MERAEKRLEEIASKYKVLRAPNRSPLHEKAELADARQQRADAKEKNEELYQASQEPSENLAEDAKAEHLAAGATMRVSVMRRVAGQSGKL